MENIHSYLDVEGKWEGAAGKKSEASKKIYKSYEFIILTVETSHRIYEMKNSLSLKT